MSLWTSITRAVRGLLPAAASIALPGIGGAAVGAVLGASRRSAGAGAPHFAPRRSNLPVPGARGAIERFLPGGKTGYVSRGRYHPGKLSGQNIPNGYHEAMDHKTGQIYLTKNRRRRGITARDLSNFRRVHRLLKRYGKLK